QYMTTNKEGSVEVLRRAVGIEDKETLDHAYEQMRIRADVDLIPPEAAVDNLIKMMTYIDKRASSIDRTKLADYSIFKELARISHNGNISRAASAEKAFTSIIRGDQHYCHGDRQAIGRRWQRFGFARANARFAGVAIPSLPIQITRR